MDPLPRFTTRSGEPWPGRLIDSLLPPVCAVCGLRTGGPAICAPCLDDLPWQGRVCARCALPLPEGAGPVCAAGCALPTGAPLSRVVAPLAYRDPVDRLVLGAKFGANLAHATLLGELLLAGLQPKARTPPPGTPPMQPPGPDSLVVPVPLHWRRLVGRGYNQAAEIARAVATGCGLPFRPDVLARPRATPAQSALRRAARQRNLRRAFAARPLTGSEVILVDDVATTLATGLAAARCLQAAGASRVELWVVARALPHRPRAPLPGAAAAR